MRSMTCIEGLAGFAATVLCGCSPVSGKAGFYIMKYHGPTRCNANACSFRYTQTSMSNPNSRKAGPAPDAAMPRNYMTPEGYARLKQELLQLLDVERPELVKVVSWAASNGDRSENGDYLYGKKRLREIDRRIHYLNKRLDKPEVVDPAARGETDRIFFGATVDYIDAEGNENTVSIVGIDEVDPARGHVSWISPIAKALLKRRTGDTVRLMKPGGAEDIEIVDVRYQSTAAGAA